MLSCSVMSRILRSPMNLASHLRLLCPRGSRRELSGAANAFLQGKHFNSGIEPSSPTLQVESLLVPDFYQNPSKQLMNPIKCLKIMALKFGY